MQASPSSQQQQQGRSIIGPSQTQFSFPEEHGIVLDRWLYDVCGEEGMQFPSHRRAQYPAFIEHCRYVSKQRNFVAGTFAYPSRSGTREVLVLQTMLEALGAREQECLKAASKIDANIAQFKKVLSEKTMGASDLNGSQTKPARAAAGEAGDALPQQQPQQIQNGSAATVAIRQQGYTTLTSSGGDASDRSTTDFSDVDAREARRAQYEQKRSIAERYTRELIRKTEEMRTKRTAMEARHKQLLTEKLQLDNEYKALEATENIVVGRHEEAAAQLVEEREALARERAEWAALSGDAPPPQPPHSPDSKDEQPPSPEDAFNNSVLHLNQTLVAAAETSVSPEEHERQATLQQLRGQLSDIGAALQDLKRQLLNGEQVHAGRFKASKQRLKDWQDVVANVRRTHHQLRGQVSVLSIVVQDTAERLAANTAAADTAGYLDQVYRFNALLAERSSEKLRAFLGEEETASPTALQDAGLHGGVSAFTTEVKPLVRPAPSAGRLDSDNSAAATPLHGGAAAATATPTSGYATPQRHFDVSNSNSPSSGQQQQPKHRSRYSLVRHLQRWEVALQTERAQLLEAAGMDVSDRTTGENAVKPQPDGPLNARSAHQRQKILKLQKMLLLQQQSK